MSERTLWGFPIVEVDEAEFIARRVAEAAAMRHQENNKQRIAASLVCTYEAQEEFNVFGEMRLQIGRALAPLVAEFIADGRDYNFVWSWENSKDENYRRHTLKCDGVAWLSFYRDCAIGELTNDPALTKENPMVCRLFIEEDESKTLEFQKVECTGAGVGFIRLQ